MPKFWIIVDSKGFPIYNTQDAAFLRGFDTVPEGMTVDAFGGVKWDGGIPIGTAGFPNHNDLPLWGHGLKLTTTANLRAGDTLHDGERHLDIGFPYGERVFPIYRNGELVGVVETTTKFWVATKGLDTSIHSTMGDQEYCDPNTHFEPNLNWFSVTVRNEEDKAEWIRLYNRVLRLRWTPNQSVEEQRQSAVEEEKIQKFLTDLEIVE